jgi:predicted TPR repeat methyltransferase
MPVTGPSASGEADLLCDEGYASLEAGRFERAHALLGRARMLAPGNPLIHYRLGLLFIDTGRLGEALDALDATLRLQPGNARAHNNRGSVLQRLGRLAEAEEAFRLAIKLDPDLVPPYLNIGKLLEQRGEAQEAVELYERAIARGLDAAMLGHNLAAASGQVTRRAPDRWVRSTSDDLAATFDAHLRGLGYGAPRQIAAMLHSRNAGALDILDLGCGTGQCGLHLANQKGHLVGVDLSEKMLVQARARGIYDELHVGEIHAWLCDAATARFDVVIAADVLVYIGALEELFREVARTLRTGGWFAFSTEEHESTDYTLLPTGRYAHSQSYVLGLARTAFAVIDAKPEVIRIESGKPLAGRLYLLQRN